MMGLPTEEEIHDKWTNKTRETIEYLIDDCVQRNDKEELELLSRIKYELMTWDRIVKQRFKGLRS
jgi:hypothetical protein